MVKHVKRFYIFIHQRFVFELLFSCIGA
uniref:Uncharacterized protein n=1 Tax=Rhizophora mucronata TaxID=61149 RepID=A0A2P2PDD4_RHIMU